MNDSNSEVVIVSQKRKRKRKSKTKEKNPRDDKLGYDGKKEIKFFFIFGNQCLWESLSEKMVLNLPNKSESK